MSKLQDQVVDPRQLARIIRQLRQRVKVLETSGGGGGAEEITGIYKAMLSDSFSGGQPGETVPDTVIREISNTTGLDFVWKYGGIGVISTDGLFGDGEDHTEDLAINVGSTFSAQSDTITAKNHADITFVTETEASVYIDTISGDADALIIEIAYKPIA